MIRTIVVALDGSAFAEAALGVAAKLARAAKAELDLLAVHEPQLLLLPVAEIPVAAGADEGVLRARLQGYLADQASRLGTVGPGPVRFEVVDGTAGGALTRWIDQHAPDLVVMSTHGRGPLSRFWLGSVADHVIRHVTAPVLLVRPAAELAKGADSRLGSVLVSLDLSPESERILEPITDLALLADTHVTLVHVVEPIPGIDGTIPPVPIPMVPDLIEGRRVQAQKYLDEIAARLQSRGLRVATRVEFSPGVAGTILRLLEEGPIDYAAMTTHGAGGFRRALMGSVADKVIRGADRPVLVFRPGPR